MNPEAKLAFDAWVHRRLANGKTLADCLTTPQAAIAENTWADAWDAAREAKPATNPFVIKQIIDERKDAPDMVRKVDEWISAKDQAPGFIQSCDWLFPVSHLKCERWMLCGESSMTASVPGAATHWRPAQALPLV